MANFSAVSSEVYTILRSYDYVLDLYDEKSNKVYEPDQARKFFASKTSHNKTQNLLVAVDDLNSSSTIQLNTGPSSDSVALSGLWETLKTCATKYNMIYSLETHDKEIHPKNFATAATMHEGKSHMIDLTENMYGTSRSSYLRIGESKMIVRHNKRIEAEAPGARSRCVESIFIENAQGERHLMPNNDLAAGRAMGQHVNQGGSWADPVADQINSMAGYFSDLGSSASYLGGAGALCEGAEDLRAKCRGKRKAIRESFNRMFREASYAAESARFASMGETPLLEGEGLERLREQLTVKGRKLPESVVNACARLMAEGDEPEEMLDEQAPQEIAPPEDTPEGQEAAANATVKVLGREVATPAWEALKQGKMDIRVTPDLAETPHFKNVTAQIMFKLNALAAVVLDDTLANLFSSVYDEYVNGALEKDPAGRSLVTKLGIAACRAADIQIVTEGNLGPKGVDAIMEMQQWFSTFHPDRVLLAESECKREAEDCKSDADALDDCEGEVKELKGKLKDKEKVDESEYEDDSFGHASFGRGDRVIVKGGHGYEDTVGETGTVIGSEPSHHGTEFADDIFVELDSQPGQNYRYTADALDPASLSEDLTQEDILLPKDQGLDLADEVVARGEDDEDMSRMLTLAGRPLR